MPNASNLSELVSDGASWAWHTSLAVLPVMVLLLLLGRWRSFPANWRLILAAVVAVRLLLPMVPGVAWHPWSKGMTAPVAIAPVGGMDAEVVTPLHVSTLVSSPAVFSVSGAAVLGVIWLAGAVLIAVWALGSHFRLRSLIQRNSRPADETVRSTLTWSRQRMGLHQAPPILQIRGLPTMAN